MPREAHELDIGQFAHAFARHRWHARQLVSAFSSASSVTGVTAPWARSSANDHPSLRSGALMIRGDSEARRALDGIGEVVAAVRERTKSIS